MKVKYNNKEYEAVYNKQTGFYEIDLTAPLIAGMYNIEATYTDLLNQTYTKSRMQQVLNEEKIEVKDDRTFMWVFDNDDFKLKEIVELGDEEISIDEETNSNSTVHIIKKINAKADDIVVIKENNKEIYWGIIKEIKNENGQNLYEYILKYITNMFDQDVVLSNQNMINETGIEDFIAKTITDNFINNTDTFVNKSYLKVVVKTHTKKQTSVTNVQDNIYNLHTWMTNCTQYYNITYDISIVNKQLVITIENKQMKKRLIDVTAQSISNYAEVFETNIVSKVTVLTKEEGEYNLYLLSDRTTTTDKTNQNRAKGRAKIVYTEKMENAAQKALDVIKSNSYNHNITFKMNEYIKVGTPIAIKTKNNTIFDSYISAIKITKNNFYEYICGNIRIKFIEKILKERKG